MIRTYKAFLPENHFQNAIQKFDAVMGDGNTTDALDMENFDSLNHPCLLSSYALVKREPLLGWDKQPWRGSQKLTTLASGRFC
jgi:hypothetical protein